MTITTYIRKPSIVVTLNGSALTGVLSARTSHGFNQRVAEASVTLRALPVGIAPWDTVVIKLDAATNPATTVRFTGYFTSADLSLWPQEVTLNCRGKLAKADLEAETNVDMSSFAVTPNNYGHHDETMVSTVLYICGLAGAWVPNGEDTLTGIGGTGRTLGLISKGYGFQWDEGSSGMSFIERLDEVCLGWRTYDTASGDIVRTQITTIPSATVAATFTEGVDIYRAGYGKTILEARNKVTVEGYPGENPPKEPAEADQIKYVAYGGNQYLLRQDGSQWFMAEKMSSAMIEHKLTAGATGLSCEEVANWRLAELNVWAEKLSLTTPLDTSIAPGVTIAVTSPTLGIDTRYWVQQVDVEVTRQGAFSQVFTCVGWQSLTSALVAPVEISVTLPAVAATYVAELSAAVVPIVVGVTISEGITVILPLSFAHVRPIVVSVTLPAVTATFISEWSVTVAPVVVNVTIPAVTCTAVVPIWYRLLETGDYRLLESGDKRILE